LKGFKSHKHRCRACDLSHDVYVHNGRRENWYLNYDLEGNALCSRCYQTIIRAPHRFQTQQERNEFLRQNNRGQVPPNKGKRTILNRQCYICGSNKTYIDSRGFQCWMANVDSHGNVLHYACSFCRDKYFKNVKRRVQHWIHWKGKQFPLKYNPRTGFCSQCGYVGDTDLHHTSYESDDPLENTVELCKSCHTKETLKLTKAKWIEEYLKAKTKL
jgi:hypothetical protein